jgi:hypothetical protein
MNHRRTSPDLEEIRKAERADESTTTDETS